MIRAAQVRAARKRYLEMAKREGIGEQFQEQWPRLAPERQAPSQIGGDPIVRRKEAVKAFTLAGGSTSARSA